jgi:hypothetical protein
MSGGRGVYLMWRPGVGGVTRASGHVCMVAWPKEDLDMSDPSGSRSPATTSSAPPSGSASSASPLVSSQGRTHIASVVVSKIAGLAAREIAGVHALGGGAARLVGTIRERIPGATSNVSQGVRVEVGEKQAAVDLDVVVEYGVAITDVAAAFAAMSSTRSNGPPAWRSSRSTSPSTTCTSQPRRRPNRPNRGSSEHTRRHGWTPLSGAPPPSTEMRPACPGNDVHEVDLAT